VRSRSEEGPDNPVKHQVMSPKMVSIGIKLCYVTQCFPLGSAVQSGFNNKEILAHVREYAEAECLGF
jgi:hypothetical protein